MGQIWSYSAGSNIQTPPAYSQTRNKVIVGTQDLYVHAINNADGSQSWKVKPTPHSGSSPYEYIYSYPVIAEQHGLVLMKIRLDWDTLWTWNPWPGDNSQMRSNLQSNPGQQALFALNLDNGNSPFICNVGHGGWGDGGYMPMSFQPVVKRFSDGTEVAYVIMRGSPCIQNPCDGRWDAHLGEMLLDDTTISGYKAGYVRFIKNTFFPSDEMGFISMSGNHIFASHWMYGLAHEITDRSASRGTGSNQIQTSNLPHIMESQASGGGCSQSNNHYCSSGLVNAGDTRNIPAGFWIYWNVNKVYDSNWNGYAIWTVSNNNVYYRSNTGAIIALESGSPNFATGNMVKVHGLAEDSETIDVWIEDKPSTGPAVIPYGEAWDHVGETKTVEGTLRYLVNNGKAVYLGFKNPHQGEIVIRVMKEDWTNFPMSPEKMYKLGQKIQATGKIVWYQGDPVIYVSYPLEIRVV